MIWTALAVVAFVGFCLAALYVAVRIAERRAWDKVRDSRLFAFAWYDRPLVTWTRRPLYDHEREGDF